MLKNRNLLIIALIAVVNALGYGIIIPILYSYSRKYGLTDFENGLLFSFFSIAQFFATPIIGRLSDKYGRKPLLVISLLGTAVSFTIMAYAPSAIYLFIARILDGLTSGNLPVAQAVISDSTDVKDRAKGFGVMGAAFGFGFIFGPAISALTLTFSASAPFIIAAIVSALAVILTALLLPETNTHRQTVIKGKFFDWQKLFGAVFDEAIGDTLLISLLYILAFSMFIYAFQPYSVEVLRLDATKISLIFTGVGIMGLITQVLILPRVIRILSERKLLSLALSASVIVFLVIFLVRNIWIFLIAILVNAVANGLVMPMITTLLSKEMDEKSQGSIMGLNTSYQSIGFIFGPIIGGALASLLIPLPFLFAGLTFLICYFLSRKILKVQLHKKPAFDI